MAKASSKAEKEEPKKPHVPKAASKSKKTAAKSKATKKPKKSPAPKPTKPETVLKQPKITDKPAETAKPAETPKLDDKPQPPATVDKPAETAKPAETPKPDDKPQPPATVDKPAEEPEETPPPKPKEYTSEEIAEIAKKVETYSDQTPAYNPKHILSPEYKGTSNYEEGIRLVRQETEDRLAAMQADPEASPQQLRQAEEDLKTLDHLYENFNIGMNVFRTAHGGRGKLRK